MSDFCNIVREFDRMSHELGADRRIFMSAMNNPEAFERAVENFTKTHPKKTYMSELKKKFPDADTDTVVGCMCPGDLFSNAPTREKEHCAAMGVTDCRSCWCCREAK